MNAKRDGSPTKMLTMPWPLLLLILHLVNADVAQLGKNYFPPDAEQPSNRLADEEAPASPTQSNDGPFYQMGGLMLPSGYAIPTGSNVPPPPMTPPNFPLPIYPPFFGFGGGPEGFGMAGGQVPPGYEAQFPGGQFPIGPQAGGFPTGPQGPTGQFPIGQQGGQFPVGPQGGPFPGGLQGGQFPVGPQGGPFPGGPQGGLFNAGPQAVPFPTGPQGGPFPVGPQAGPFPGGPIPYPPDYLTMQGLPSPAMPLVFQQNVGFGAPNGFVGGPQSAYPFQQLVNVGQPFSPSFGIPGQQYQPQQFADEPQPAANEKPKSSAAKTLAKSRNKDTIYASNGGYIYKRAK